MEIIEVKSSIEEIKDHEVRKSTCGGIQMFVFVKWAGTNITTENPCWESLVKAHSIDPKKVREYWQERGLDPVWLPYLPREKKNNQQQNNPAQAIHNPHARSDFNGANNSKKKKKKFFNYNNNTGIINKPKDTPQQQPPRPDQDKIFAEPMSNEARNKRKRIKRFIQSEDK